MGKESYVGKLYNEMWNKLYSKIPGVKEIEGINSSNYFERSFRKQVNDLYIEYYLNDQSKADDLYREMLDINRKLITDAINELSIEEFKNWITGNFNLQKDDLEVPLLLVKAVGNNAVQKDDPLALAIGGVDTWEFLRGSIGGVSQFKAYVDSSSVQDYIISLKGATDLNLKMTIRSDRSVKPGRAPSSTGRLGMMGGLKHQYSGIK